MKKFLAISLAVLMLLAALAACSNTPDGTDTQAATGGNNGGSDVVDDVTDAPTNEWGESEVTNIIDDEKLDFQGVTIGIAARPETRYRREFSVETMADPVDQRIFKRNSAIEKQINVKMQFVEAGEFWTTDGIVQFVTTEYQSGVNSAVDVVAPYAAFAVTSALRGFYVNFAGDELPWMDTTQHYWNQSFVEQATCFDQLYYIVGDVNLTVYDKSLLTFVNMDLAQANGINPDDLYAAVENMEWTYQYMYDIVNNFTYMDNNSNNTVDAADTVAIASIKDSEAYDGFVRAWDMVYLTKNDDGTHTLTVDGNTKLENGVTMMKDLYSLPAVYLDSIGNTFDTAFIGGNVLFDVDILYRNANSNTALRNVDFTYAVLPLPMYDDTQDKYLTTPQDAYNNMSVMGHHPEKLEAVSATLELLASKSYDDVRPFYIEKMVKATYVSGAKPVKMLEIGMAGSSFDTATIYYSQVNSVSYALWRSTIKADATVADRWAERRSETEAAVQDFDSWFQAAA